MWGVPETTTGASTRRVEVIRAAMRAFANRGFDGSTLNDIAREAGVSQPRISQIFGNKENAFLEALRMSAGLLMGALEDEAARTPADFANAFGRMRYSEPEALVVVFQGFTTTTVPGIREASRRIFSDVVEVVVTRAGHSYQEALHLLGRGFVIHHVLAADLPTHVEESPHFVALLDAIGPVRGDWATGSPREET